MEEFCNRSRSKALLEAGRSLWFPSRDVAPDMFAQKWRVVAASGQCCTFKSRSHCSASVFVA